MLRIAWLLLAFSGCVLTPDHEQIPLAELDQTTIEIEPPTANPGYVAIYFDTQSIDHPGDNPAECPTATSSLHATADGTALTLEETGGWDAPVDGTSECHQIRFTGTIVPNTTSSQIVIADDSATWTITTHSFATFDQLVVQQSPHGELVVASALGQSIDYLELDITQGTSEITGVSAGGPFGETPIRISGAMATMPLTLTGPVTIEVDGRTIAKPTCDGPVDCKLEDPLGGMLAVTL